MAAVVARRGLAPPRRGASLGLGDAAEAARLAGRPLLRAEPGQPRDLPAPGGRELALERRSPIRTRRRPSRSPPTSRAYGPATIDAFGNWLAGGWFGKRQLRAWFGDARRRGSSRSTSTASARTSSPRTSTSWRRRSRRTAVRLLPGFDQYVLGPGTADGHVVPASRRAAVSRQSGWISPVVVAGGSSAARGSWTATDVRVAWFAEAGRPPRNALRAEVARLSAILGRDLTPVATVT